ncbi:transposase [Daejeonia sp. YH14]|uniref:transposase n=1 Tax=Daejeonia sp. YH14 TaxID=3439042 RepID=UPI003F493B75
MNLKNIHIGQMIEKRVAEYGIGTAGSPTQQISRICNSMKCTEKDLKAIFASKDLPTGQLLKWSKLLEYDFFRIYSQHLILYAPVSAKTHNVGNETRNKKSVLPKFRKNLYTKEIIDFILEEIDTGSKSKKQIIEEYGIPKTTLYKWIAKYRNSKTI